MNGDNDDLVCMLNRSVMNSDIKSVASALNNLESNSDSQIHGSINTLHLAAWNGDEQIVKLLIDAGFDVNFEEEITGRTPIFSAQSYEVAKILIDDGADVNVQDKHDKNTILHGRVFQTKIVELVLDAGFDFRLKNRAGWSALHFHTANDHYWLIEKLLNSGFDIDDVTLDGQTAIDIASYYGAGVSRVLLEQLKFKNMFNVGQDAGEGIGL